MVVDPTDANALRGGALKFFACRDPRSILSGPSDTGKTWTALSFLHTLCCAYPGSQHVMARKTYSSIASSCAQTFNRIIAGCGVRVLGSDSPRLYTYPNGAQVWVAGLDNAEKALSSERDSIYVNQCEQVTAQDWEMLGSRCTGRGAVVKWPRLFGDCNPGGSLHWIRQYAKEGRLTLFNGAHRDNPTIYDRAGQLLPEASRRLDALASLTGVRRKRLFEGVWATAEGAVYDNFDAAVHVLHRPAADFKRFFLALDEGFTNPAVVLLVGEDADGRWHVAREFYQTGQLQETVVKQVKAWHTEFKCQVVAVDAAAAGLVADLKALGLPARGGKGRVKDGIDRLQNRLKVAGDGRPRLTFAPECVNCVNEFESYVWEQDRAKDMPKKEHDHTSDALRYLEDVLAGGTGDAQVFAKREALVARSERGRTLM